MVNLAVRRKRFNQKRSSRFSAKPAPVNPSRRPRCSTPMRIHVGSVMFANAVGGFCVDGEARGVCADAGRVDTRARSTRIGAVRILMRDLKSNRSAKAVFAKTRENLRKNGRCQGEDAEGDQTEMFIRL